MSNKQALEIMEIYRQQLEDSGGEYEWEYAMNDIKELPDDRYQIAREVMEQYAMEEKVVFQVFPKGASKSILKWLEEKTLLSKE